MLTKPIRAITGLLLVGLFAFPLPLLGAVPKVIVGEDFGHVL
jgi:hypothetical protein